MIIASVFTGVIIAAITPRAELTDWFTESYTGVNSQTATGWKDDAGTWTQTSGDTSSCADGQLKVSANNGQLNFSPTAGSAGTGNFATFTAKMKFGKFDTTAEMPAIASDAKGALSVIDTNGLTFVTWTTTRDTSVNKGSWTILKGVTPTAGGEYTVKVEVDPNCTPTRVRYTVDGTVLTDVLGNSWFSTRSGDKKLSQVSFAGNGKVGTITAQKAGSETSRAKVEFARVAQVKVGTELSFAVTPDEQVEITGTPTYKWYLMDAAGMRAETPLDASGATYAITGSEFGHWLVVDVSDDNGYLGTGRTWVSDLPVMYIDVKDGAWPSASKEKHDAHFYIGALPSDEKGKPIYNGDDGEDVDPYPSTINVRGNSTAGGEKKPYKIKLNKKTDLFGMGGGEKNKHWVLLANYFDESLMRNKVCYDLAGVFGAPVWMRSEWVDVVMNGDYVGNYQLCQHIRVSKERINIYDWSGAAESIAEKALEANPGLGEDDQGELEDLLELDCNWMTTGRFTYLGTNYIVKAKGTPGVDPESGDVTVVWKKFSTDISGGYVFEIDAKKVTGGGSVEASNFKQTVTGLNGSMQFNVALNTPEYGFTNSEVSNTVWNLWWNLGQAYTSGTGIDPGTGKHYTELADLDSMVAYWLSMFVPGNNDSAAYSRYSFVDVGGKMVFGPAWDFDYGSGSLQIRTRDACETNEFGAIVYRDILNCGDAYPMKWIPRPGTDNFMGQWGADPYFDYLVRERYLATRQYLEDLVKDGGIIDGYTQYLANSARANDLRWNNRIGFFGNANEEGDVAVFKRYLKLRLAWLDQKFTNVGKAIDELQGAVANTKLKFVRDSTLTVNFANTEPVPGSIETDITNVKRVMKSSDQLDLTVNVPAAGAASLLVYVNGVPKPAVDIVNGSAALSVSRKDLKVGAENFFTFVARKSDGATIVSRNVALFTCERSEDGFYMIFR